MHAKSASKTAPTATGTSKKLKGILFTTTRSGLTNIAALSRARERHSARLNRSDLRGVLGRPGPLCKPSWALHSARFPKNHKKKLEKKDPMRNLKKTTGKFG